MDMWSRWAAMAEARVEGYTYRRIGAAFGVSHTAARKAAMMWSPPQPVQLAGVLATLWDGTPVGSRG